MRGPLCGVCSWMDVWILGLSEGYTRCANSVNPIYDGIRTVEDRIPLCEETCANHSLATTFKITPMAVEMGLDRALEVRSLRPENRQKTAPCRPVPSKLPDCRSQEAARKGKGSSPRAPPGGGAPVARGKNATEQTKPEAAQPRNRPTLAPLRSTNTAAPERAEHR